jgi:TfoX/Sxy family transcriptional regulator of competence genes
MDMVSGEEVTVKTKDTVMFGTVYGEVFLKGGGNVGHQLVKEGHARWDKNAEPTNTLLEKLEREARESGRGLWSDVDAVEQSNAGDFFRTNKQNRGALQVVKKDREGRCIAPGSIGYDDLDDYTEFVSIQECQNAGGRLDLSGFPIGRIKIAD